MADMTGSNYLYACQKKNNFNESCSNLLYDKDLTPVLGGQVIHDIDSQSH
jgi:hypothetical protein